MAKDPISGMTIKEETGLISAYGDQIYYFCSSFFKNLFDRDPERYAGPNRIFVSPGTERERTIAYFSIEIGIAIKIVYLANYDMELTKLLTSGVDLWLNTPKKPMEASGTSGIKAVNNGVPNLSVLDG